MEICGDFDAETGDSGSFGNENGDSGSLGGLSRGAGRRVHLCVACWRPPPAPVQNARNRRKRRRRQIELRNAHMDGRDPARLIDHLVERVDAAPFSEAPFVHLTLAQFFPADIYDEMLRSMPRAADYQALPGRNGVNLKADGSSTRVKIDLFPELVRRLPAEQRRIWLVVGKALCATKVRDAFMRKLAPGLQRRFGERYRRVGMYPIPVLTRDIAGYQIPPHTDTRWKGITVQLYLPADDTHSGIGTIFHGVDGEGKLTHDRQMPFTPNSGYAFAVTDVSWHSANKVAAGVNSRDSILLTYFVDDSLLQRVRNRAKRAGNFLLNEARSIGRRAPLMPE